MAFARGDFITADKLNEINSQSKEFYVKSQGGNGWQSIDWVYVHQGGYVKFRYERFYIVGIGPVDGIKYKLSKLVDGRESVIEEYETSGQSPAATDYYYASQYGEGWYRAEVWANRPTVFGGPWCSCSIVPSSTTSVKGDFLKCYDKPSNSGNPIPGEKLTAEILNSGNVFTTHYL